MVAQEGAVVGSLDERRGVGLGIDERGCEVEDLVVRCSAWGGYGGLGSCHDGLYECYLMMKYVFFDLMSEVDHSRVEILVLRCLISRDDHELTMTPYKKFGIEPNGRETQRKEFGVRMRGLTLGVSHPFGVHGRQVKQGSGREEHHI